jgi:hypothetical protein
MYNITNRATVKYLQRLARENKNVMIDVVMVPKRDYFSYRHRYSRHRRTIWRDNHEDFGRLSHMLYLASPVLTLTAITFMVLMRECMLHHQARRL